MELVGYRGAHNRVRSKRGPAYDYLCDMCRDVADQWAYDHSDPKPQWSTFKNRKVPFSSNPDRYVPLCRSCHLKVDRYGYNLTSNEET